ncbi:MAG: hypothetical protein HC888_12400 [Candidatus Competibacteraceae bacterium]|nr:hypothetical protein [Candidatus Competibacteraceae bacterium]
MYPAMVIDEHDEYYLRPMNCPHHHKVFGARPHSYRDLPLRLAEYGNTYRYEKHGSLAGLLRVRAMCMNDAHIYCTPEQVEQEFNSVISMYRHYYGHLRMGNFRVRLSLHDPKSDKFVDNEEAWNRCEDIVRDVLKNLGVDVRRAHGEAAFYGPKVDIQVKKPARPRRDRLHLPARLRGRRALRPDLQRFGRPEEAPVYPPPRPALHPRADDQLPHRTLRRAFPTWMAPVQVQLIPVKDEVLPYAQEIEHLLRGHLFRVQTDTSDESFNKKIRNAITRKCPNIWVLGGKEMDEKTITWRRYCTKLQQTVPLTHALHALERMRKERMMDNFDDVALPLED